MVRLSFVGQAHFIYNLTPFIIQHCKYFSVSGSQWEEGRSINFVLRKTSGGVKRHFWLSQVGEEVLQLYRVEVRDAAKHLRREDRPTTKVDLAPHASRTEAEKLWYAFLITLSFSTSGIKSI